MTHAVIIEKNYTTTISWRKGRIVVAGESKRVPEFEDYLSGQFEFPKAPREVGGQTSPYVKDKRVVKNEFELMTAVMHMANEKDLRVIYSKGVLP